MASQDGASSASGEKCAPRPPVSLQLGNPVNTPQDIVLLGIRDGMSHGEKCMYEHREGEEPAQY